MGEFRIATLASGSSGNSIYAESADGAILIDAGISGKKAADAIRKVGGHIDRVDCVIVTHDHSDHSSGAGVLSRRHGIPLLMTEGTFHGSRRSIGKKVVGPRTFAAGGQVCAGGFHIHTIPTPHDGTDPVALVLERKGLRCGILTDLGHPFEKLKEVMRTLHAVILESNYDPHMLKNGRYPESVKRRIFSDRGHISNQEAAMLVREYGDNLNFVMLAHLSKDNNTPELAYRCMMEEAAERIAKNPIKVILAPRHDTSDIIVIRG